MVVRGNHDPRHALFPRSGAVYATSPRAVQLEARGRPTPNPNPNPNPNPSPSPNPSPNPNPNPNPNPDPNKHATTIANVAVAWVLHQLGDG